DHRMSRGSKSTIKSVRPGIMPSLFGKHLIDKAVFLSLTEVADNLPPLEEACVPVTMDRELAAAYRKEVEEPLAEAIKEMMKRREAWIAEHGPTLDVIISHPRLVETGLDLFDKAGRHNFPTICFFECLCGAPHKHSYVASSIMWRPAGFLGTARGLTRPDAT